MTAKTPLGWKQKRTPKRGTRRARSWRRIERGYTFPGSAWTVTEAPYRRIKGCNAGGIVRNTYPMHDPANSENVIFMVVWIH